MGIPFYRHVKYWDDGHDIFQCLQCGSEIDVGSGYQPRFCSDCGVEYKGFILPKKYDYVSVLPTKELYFQVEGAYKWGDNPSETELRWTDSWPGCYDSAEAVKDLKRERAKRVEENKRDKNPGWVFRITVIKKDRHGSYINIDVDEYRRRTGKKFDRKLYDRVR